MLKTGLDMYVFRDGRKSFTGRELLDRLAKALACLSVAGDRDCVLRALIAGGELECALRDVADVQPEWKDSAQAAERLTTIAAEMFVRNNRRGVAEAKRIVAGMELPRTLAVSVPEGFAYYALHPQKFVDVIRNRSLGSKSAVIGIRSIGAPLSAVVAAAIGDAKRITVRPAGHPYERGLEITETFRAFVARHRDEEFVIVDEGPGLSGSSFLAVAEALERSGVAASQITMLGSRKPDIPELRTPNASERWPRYRFVPTDAEPVLPEGAGQSIGGGWWRRLFLPDFKDQPASWTQLEMSKYLSRDRKCFYKFEGFGHFGEEIGDRAKLLERFGFGPRYLGNEDGFGKYELINGELLRQQDVSRSVLDTMALYCAMRGRELIATSREESRLPQMLAWNWKCEFGEELPTQNLEVVRLVTADARMLPHEWIASDGRFLKLDANSHGDDHFFPGPCDIAWDLAGAIVEWDMELDAREHFIDAYIRESGDLVRPRLGAYLLAYATFRMGWSKMAAHASAGEFDQQLLDRDYQRYRHVCSRLREVAAAA
jgi:orotate phosphoribosyltransferase-like protein